MKELRARFIARSKVRFALAAKCSLGSQVISQDSDARESGYSVILGTFGNDAIAGIGIPIRLNLVFRPHYNK